MALHCPPKKVTGRYQGKFNDCDQYALISYRFLIENERRNQVQNVVFILASEMN